jgi:hypothetical protein
MMATAIALFGFQSGAALTDPGTYAHRETLSD